MCTMHNTAEYQPLAHIMSNANVVCSRFGCVHLAECGVLLTSDIVAATDNNNSAINGTTTIAQQLHSNAA